MSILRKLLAIALILLMQGPAMLVQEVAWVKMLVSYTQERGLKRGIIETFDGSSPCGLCKKADEIRRHEQPQDPPDKQPPSPRQRLAWMEMLAGDPLKIPSIAGHDISLRIIAGPSRDPGKDAEAPGSPPPEWS